MCLWLAAPFSALGHSHCGGAPSLPAHVRQVDTLARLLGNIFPMRNDRVSPYHLSVLDWLLSRGEHPVHEFTVDADLGHALLASACCKLLLGSPLPMALPQSWEQGGEEEQQAEGEVQCRPQVGRRRCSAALRLVGGGAVPPSGW